MSEALLAQIDNDIRSMQQMLGMANEPTAPQVVEQEEERESKPGISFTEFKRDKWKAWSQDGNAAPAGSGWYTDGTILLKASALKRKPPYKKMIESSHDAGKDWARSAHNCKVVADSCERLFNSAKNDKSELWRGTRDEWINVCVGKAMAVLLTSPGMIDPPVPIDPSKAKLIEYLIPGVEYWCKRHDVAAPIQLQVDGELVGLLMPLRVADAAPKDYDTVAVVKAAYQGRVK